jgi:hypothetical protein
MAPCFLMSAGVLLSDPAKTVRHDATRASLGRITPALQPLAHATADEGTITASSLQAFFLEDASPGADFPHLSPEIASAHRLRRLLFLVGELVFITARILSSLSSLRWGQAVPRRAVEHFISFRQRQRRWKRRKINVKGLSS